MPTTISNSARMTPQGHGPFGGTSRSLAGIHPVEAIRNSGNADILAIFAPERDQKSRMRMTQCRSTALIVDGCADNGKVTKAQALWSVPVLSRVRKISSLRGLRTAQWEALRPRLIHGSAFMKNRSKEREGSRLLISSTPSVISPVDCCLARSYTAW